MHAHAYASSIDNYIFGIFCIFIFANRACEMCLVPMVHVTRATIFLPVTTKLERGKSFVLLARKIIFLPAASISISRDFECVFSSRVDEETIRARKQLLARFQPAMEASPFTFSLRFGSFSVASRLVTRKLS